MEKKSNHTFIVCAYKESEYLESCVQSLIGQTVSSNIIISTATPNDYITGIAEKYDLPVYTHEGSGIARDWNEGMKIPDTDYVTLAHQDDIYRPDYLNTCLKLFEKHPKGLIAFTDYDEIKDNKVLNKSINLKIKRILLAPIKWFPNSKFIRRRSLSLGSAICCPAVSYNKKLLEGFQFDSTYTVDLDWEAWTRISKMDGAFCYSDCSLMYHRIHESSETSNAIANNQRTKEDRIMFQKYWPNFIVEILMKFYVKSQDTN